MKKLALILGNGADVIVPQRFLNDTWRRLHGWRILKDTDGVKTWVRR